MRFAPKTKEELANESLLPEGVYPFEVLDAVDTLSKAGNEMLKLKLVVFGDGSSPHVYDYLLEKLAYKLRHFAEACSLLAEYEAGELTAQHCLNKEGYCKLGIERQDGYEPRNTVKDYVPPKEPATYGDPLTAVPVPPPPAPRQRPRPQPAPQPADDFSDDIPF
jgi:hypothetical protein